MARFPKRFGLYVVLGVVLAAATPTLADIIYVEVGATGRRDGSSWCDAYRELQAALRRAQPGDEIRVAAGTYRPDYDRATHQHNGDREATFQLLTDVALRGGYAGCSAPNPNARDIALHETTLSGDLANNDVPVADPADLRNEPTRSENAYHVVTSRDIDATAILDGFTITGGNANGSPPSHAGGGMYNDNGSPALTDCTFSGNSANFDGGGMFNDRSSPTLTNCAFRGNSAIDGGGMFNEQSNSLTLTNCTFSGNTATGSLGDGGGMFNLSSSPTLVDCTFSRNTARSGGAMYNQFDRGPTLTRCTFSQNRAATGGAIYNASSSSMTLTHCTFSGNLAGGSGGGMFNNPGGNPTLTQCTFSGNTAGDDGGGIYNDSSSSAALTSCTFNGNAAGDDGGGMYNAHSTNRMALANCTFSGNSAADNGGGMLNWSSSPTLIGCTFNGNTAGGSGGGGMLNTAGSNPTLTNCKFSGNTADADGGGIYNGGSLRLAMLTNCLFSGNTAGNDGGGMYNGPGIITGLANCTFSGNTAGRTGGGMYQSGVAPMLTNCIVWGNTPDQFAGASLPTVAYSCVQGGWPGVGNIDADPLFVRDPDDGGDGWGDDPATPDLDEGANDDFGVLRLRMDSPCIDEGDNASVALSADRDGNPRVVDGDGDGSAIVDMGAYEFALPCEDADADGDGVCDSDDVCPGFDDNVDGDDDGVPDGCESGCPGISILYVDAAGLSGGDGSSWATAFNALPFALAAAVECPEVVDEIWVAAGIYRPLRRSDPSDPRTATFELINGVALYGGFAGGESERSQRNLAANVTILSGDLAHDDAPVADPADLLDEPTRTENAYRVVTARGTDATALLDGFTITGGNADSRLPLYDSGGGMYNLTSSPTLTNCAFSGNTARFAGGAIYNRSGSNSTLTDCTFTGNRAGWGAGMSNEASSNPTLTNCTFSRNTASSIGGGMFNNDSTPNLTDCTFIRNTSDNGGAGMFNQRSDPVLTNCAFSENTATDDSGGGMANSGSSPTLTGCTFTGNTASPFVGDGGGMCNLNDSNPTLTHCTFSGNWASDGGGMCNASSSPTLTRCIFNGNGSWGRGGGMLNVSDSAPKLSHCTFTGNRADSGGGMSTSRGIPTLTNCVFSGNSAAGGAGMHNIFRGSPILTHCTFSENVAQFSGGAMLNDFDSTPALANCIVWGSSPNPITDLSDSMTNITYSCVQGGWPGVGNVDANPRFARTPDAGGDGWGDSPLTPDVDEGANDDYGDLRLRAASPCIDAGDNDALPADMGDVDGDGDVLEPLPLDLAGNARRLDDRHTADTGNGVAPIVDMGAYEFLHPGDFDGDGDVDLADYVRFQGCLQGAGVVVGPECRASDLDRDGDVDLADALAVMSAFNGPGVRPAIGPFADAGPDREVSIGVAVTLDGAASTAGDAPIVAYEWFENEVLLGDGVVLVLTLDEGGHAIELRVTDAAGRHDADVVNILVRRGGRTR